MPRWLLRDPLLTLLLIGWIVACLGACADEDVAADAASPTVAATAEATPPVTHTEVQATSVPASADGGGELTYLGLSPDEAGALPIAVDSFGALFLDWSPDGSQLAYVLDGDIWVLDGDSGASTNLTQTPDRLEGFPRWAPDGTHIAFSSRAFLEGEQPQGLIASQGGPAVMNADGSDYRALAEGKVLWPPSWSAGPGWLPHAARLAFTTSENGQVAIVLASSGVLVDAYAAPKAGLGDVLGAVSFSPTRDEIAVHFADFEGGAVQEFARARQGFAIIQTGGERGLIVVREFEGPWVPLPPAEWSPDGERLLISVPPSMGQGPSGPGLWIAERGEPATFSGRAPRGTPARRAEGLVPYQARWSPDGTRIAVIENDTRQIVVLDAESLEVVERLEAPGPVEGIAWRPR